MHDLREKVVDYICFSGTVVTACRDLKPRPHGLMSASDRPNRSQVDQSIFPATVRICRFDLGSGHTPICNIRIRMPGEET
jgi:hypothetical protein